MPDISTPGRIYWDERYVLLLPRFQRDMLLDWTERELLLLLWPVAAVIVATLLIIMVASWVRQDRKSAKLKRRGFPVSPRRQR
jgi:hypothetical protein